jgi:hypothetical protein
VVVLVDDNEQIVSEVLSWWQVECRLGHRDLPQREPEPDTILFIIHEIGLQEEARPLFGIKWDRTLCGIWRSPPGGEVPTFELAA